MNKFIPVGDTFEYEGKTYKAVNASGCTGCCVLDLNDCSMFPVCSAEERDDDTSVIFVYASKKTPEDLVSTEDLEALGLTYKDLAGIYSMSYRHSDCGKIYRAVQGLLDPTKEVWDEMKGLDSDWSTSYLSFKAHFLELLFPEAVKKKMRIAELKEQQRKIQEEIDKLM